jgi:aerobic-type carbon monoxide dehydrogenase small subunit (CoxS/CutS family)
MIDGQARKSCLHLTGMVEGSSVRTIEGVADDDSLHPVQEAFLDQFSLQCGFCTPGFVLSTLALLAENPNPDRSDIEEALHGNTCRCTGYGMIFEGVEQAVERSATPDQ